MTTYQSSFSILFTSKVLKKPYSTPIISNVRLEFQNLNDQAFVSIRVCEHLLHSINTQKSSQQKD